MNNPDLYHNASAMQMTDIKEILHEHQDSFSWDRGERVLDIGCGPGNTTVTILEPLLPKDSTIVGFDISQEMVDFANKTYENEKRIFKRADIGDDKLLKNTNEEPGSFDKVFSFYCLHWVQNQRLAAQNIYNLLKEGGHALLVFLSYQPMCIMHEIMARNPLWEPYTLGFRNSISPYHFSEEPIKDCTDVFRSCGFEVQTVINRSSQFKFPSIDSFMDMVVSVNSYCNKIPGVLKEKYIKDMEAAFLNSKLVELTSDGSVIHKYKLLVVNVQKPSRKVW